MTKSHLFAERLRAAGLRVTLPRLRVLDAMLAHPGQWMSVEDIARALVARNRESAANIVCSAYRATNDLSACGILFREWHDGVGGGKAIYILNPIATMAERDCLVSIICRECGTGVLVHDPAIRARLREVAARNGLTMAERPVSVRMTCEDCSTNQ